MCILGLPQKTFGPGQSDVVNQFEEPTELVIDPQQDTTPPPPPGRNRAVPPPVPAESDDKFDAPEVRPFDDRGGSGAKRTATDEDEPRDTGGASSSTSPAGSPS